MPNIKPFLGRPISAFNSLFLLLVFCLLLGMFSGCGSESKDISLSEEISSPADQFKLPNENTTRTPAIAERKIIQNADLTLQVKDVPATVDQISDLTVNMGGYLVDSQQNRYEDKISASLSVKVPADKLTATMETISGYGELSSKAISTEDVTEEYYDAEARLRVLEAKETRLLALLEKANTITDMVSVETELGNVRSDIEVIQGRLKYLTNATSYSTINITLEQALAGSLKAPQGTLGKAWQGLINSLNTLIDFGSGLIVFLVVILPWAVVFGLFFYLIRYLYRRNKDRRSKQ